MCVADADAAELAINGLYDSVEEAAVAALGNVQKQKDADRYEYVGVVYQDPDSGRYTYTEPLSQRKRAKAGGSHAVPKGSARALYHNHPEDRRGLRAGQEDELRQYFSEGDLEVAERTGLLSFIDHGDGISVWDPKNPGQKKRSVPGLKRGEVVGVGTPVDANQAVTLLRRERLNSIFEDE